MADCAGLTEDGFLGGRLVIKQPASGYRAGIDPVLLAASVPAQTGQSVLDLGCGVGTAVLCLAARVPGLTVLGLEIQEEYADLARQNADRNAITATIVQGDIRRMPPDLRQRSVDHVLMNPPYFRRSRGTASVGGRETAMGEALPLADWIDAAVRRLAPRGSLTLIHKADRLPDVLAALDLRLGDVRVLPLASRAGRPADRILLRARKGARGPFRLLPPLVLHPGNRHSEFGPRYVPQVEAVLRKAAELPVDWR